MEGLKIIFLDIDGVLNTINHLRKQKRETGSASNKEWCPVACKNLELLCKHHEADIVLISSWRHEYGMNRIREFFSDNGIPPRYLIDRTTSAAPQTDGLNYCRGHEIKHWLHETDKKITSYVIIDDEAAMLKEQEPFLVRTGKKLGLADKNAAIEASRILENSS